MPAKQPARQIKCKKETCKISTENQLTLHLVTVEKYKMTSIPYNWMPSSPPPPFKSDSVCLFTLITLFVVTSRRWNGESFKPISELFHIFIRNIFERFILARHNKPTLFKPFQVFFQSPHCFLFTGCRL